MRALHVDGGCSLRLTLRVGVVIILFMDSIGWFIFLVATELAGFYL